MAEHVQASQATLPHRVVEGCPAHWGCISHHSLCDRQLPKPVQPCAVLCSQYRNRFQNQGALAEIRGTGVTLKIENNVGKLTSKLFQFL